MPSEGDPSGSQHGQLAALHPSTELGGRPVARGNLGDGPCHAGNPDGLGCLGEWLAGRVLGGGANEA